MEFFLKRVKAWMLVTVMVLSLVAAPGTSAAWAETEGNLEETEPCQQIPDSLCKEQFFQQCEDGYCVKRSLF